MTNYIRSGVLALMPAYGRDYKTAEEAQRAWQNGKDFQIIDGPYCSIRDAIYIHEQGYSRVSLHSRKGKLLLTVDVG